MALFETPEVSWALRTPYVVCVLNVDLGANFFLIFVCPVQYTAWDIIQEAKLSLG